jgi:hypothetical protein
VWDFIKITGQSHDARYSGTKREGTRLCLSSRKDGEKAMRMIKTTLSLILSGILMIAAVGCERQGPAERAGESIDRGVERAGDRIDDATRR